MARKLVQQRRKPLGTRLYQSQRDQRRIKRMTTAALARRRKPLRDQVVNNTTLKRYAASVRRCLSFWQRMGWQPKSLADVDAGLADYVEHCWGELEPLSYALHAVVGLCHFIPALHGQLYGTFRLIRGWERREPPKRATPFTWPIVLGLAALYSTTNS